MDKDELLKRLREVDSEVVDMDCSYRFACDEFESFVKELRDVFAKMGVNAAYEVGVLVGKLDIRRGDGIYSLKRLIGDIEKAYALTAENKEDI